MFVLGFDTVGTFEASAGVPDHLILALRNQ